MEFNEKLQQLRKNKGLTQEELADLLFVSRTAVSKWELGKGYPSIDSLKMISNFFEVSIDELMSSEQVLNLAKKESENKTINIKQIAFGLLDFFMIMFLFIPIFALKKGEIVESVSLLALDTYLYIKIPYYCLIALSVILGIFNLAFQNYNKISPKIRLNISVYFSFVVCLFFVLTNQPYPSFLVLFLLLIKCVLLLKR